MRLSELLILRISCLASPIIWALCVTRSVEEDYFYKLILPVLVIFSMSCFFRTTRGLQYCAALFVLVRYSESEIGFTIDACLVDIIFITTSWKYIGRCIQQDSLMVFKIFLLYVKRFLNRFGNIRVSMYILVCTCQTILLVFLLHRIVTFIGQLKYVNIDKSLQNPVIEVNTDSLLSRPLRPLTFWDEFVYAEETNYRSTPGQMDVLFYHSYHKRKGRDHTAIFHCENEIFRYIGEDVEMSCTWNGESVDQNFFYNHLSDYKLVWKFRGDDLKLSDRHNITETPVVVSHGKHAYPGLHFSTQLNVEHLQSADYGEYQLWLRTDYTVQRQFESSYICWIAYTDITMYDILLGRFVVTKGKIEIRTIHVPVGGLLHISVPLRIMADSEDIDVLHKIENSFTDISQQFDMDRLCKHNYFRGCSMFTYEYFKLFWRKWHSFYKDTNEIYISHAIQHNTSTHWLRSLSCVCARGYGDHSFVIQRKYYNSTTQNWTVLEIELPYIFRIVPRNWLFFYRNYSGYGEFDETVDDTYWKEFLRYIPVDEEMIWKQRIILEYCLLIIFVSELIMILQVITKVYSKLIVIPIRNIILEGRLTPRLEYFDATVGEMPNEIEPPVYDTMIVNCEADNDWVTRMVVPNLEFINHNVFLPDRDCSGGDSLIRAYANAVSQSINFVIVCSEDFIKDNWNNLFVLHQVLCQYYRVPTCRILLIKYQPCRLPQMFLTDERMHVIDWTTHLSDESKQNMLTNWARHHKCITHG